MAAAEPSPNTFKEKRKTVTGKPGTLDYMRALDDEIRFFKAEDEMMDRLVGEVGGAGSAAFKASAQQVNDRQENGANALLKLAGNIDPPEKGKYLDRSHICLKPTNTEDMYPVSNDINMMVRRNQDEYPKYVKNNESGQL